jgi:energy-coupling factor transporter ATP-binding protein EcfA2
MRCNLYPFTGVNNDQAFLHLPVYEPTGRDIRLDETDCLQHLAIIGATGCGKTTLLRRIMSQLIARPETAVIIFDAKQDDTVEFVARLAAAHKREMAVLGTEGTHFFDLFEPLKSLDDVDFMVQRLLSGTQNMGKENEFWNEIRVSLLDAALTLLVVSEPRVEFEPAMDLLSGFFFQSPLRRPVEQKLKIAKHWVAHSPPAVARKLIQTLDTVKMWRNMESRTRSSVQATLVNTLRPLASRNALRCFDAESRQALSMKHLVNNGGICVISLNATTEPDLAGLFFKLIKREFSQSVQQRRDASGCLCALIIDELPLLVTPDDVETLATVRSRRCLVCAATQSLAVLDQKLGTQQRKALLANFGSLIFMRGREEETDLSAAVQMGFTTYQIKVPRLRDIGGILSYEPETITQQRLICPPGSLGRLSPHQAFITLPNQTRYDDPVWFVPYFEKEPEPLFVPPELVDPADSNRLHRQFQNRGFRRLLNEQVWRTAIGLFPARKGRKKALAKATDFFRTRAILVPTGLESLPLPWLKALPRILWSLRRPHWTHLPYMITEVFVADGLLQFRFAQEPQRETFDEHVGGFDKVREAVNIRLYPSCYRQLKPRHAKQIKLPSLLLSQEY